VIVAIDPLHQHAYYCNPLSIYHIHCSGDWVLEGPSGVCEEHRIENDNTMLYDIYIILPLFRPWLIFAIMIQR
jgi:hypothetical protein